MRFIGVEFAQPWDAGTYRGLPWLAESFEHRLALDAGEIRDVGDRQALPCIVGISFTSPPRSSRVTLLHAMDSVTLILVRWGTLTSAIRGVQHWR